MSPIEATGQIFSCLMMQMFRATFDDLAEDASCSHGLYAYIARLVDRVASNGSTKGRARCVSVVATQAITVKTPRQEWTETAEKINGQWLRNEIVAD